MAELSWGLRDGGALRGGKSGPNTTHRPPPPNQHFLKPLFAFVSFKFGVFAAAADKARKPILAHLAFRSTSFVEAFTVVIVPSESADLVMVVCVEVGSLVP